MTVPQDPSELQSPLIAEQLSELALASRVLERGGHASRTLGHVAMRDPDRRGVWVKRSDLGLGEVRSPRDFCLIGFDGALLAGVRPHREWPLYTEVFKARLDLNYAAHTHAFYSRIFSAVDEPLVQVSSTIAYFAEPPPRFALTSDLVDTVALGSEFAMALGSHFVAFLRNHGLYFAASTLEAMVVYGLSIEEAARELILIGRSGLAWTSTPDAERQAKARLQGGPEIMKTFWAHLKRELAASERDSVST